jgi:hypothetical protein
VVGGVGGVGGGWWVVSRVVIDVVSTKLRTH